MRALMLMLTLSLALSGAAAAQGDPAARAQETLKQARAALGDDAKLKSLQSLSATGNVRRTFGENQVESELELDILLPDKIKIAQNSNFGSNAQVLNAGQVWNEFVPAVSAGGGGGFGGGRRMGGGNDPEMQSRMQAMQRAEITRLMLGMLLQAPGSVPVEYSFAGEAKAPDGTADVIDVKGPDNFTARLFIDQKTHRLLMLSYKAKQPRMMMGRGPGGPGGRPAQAGGQGQGQRPEMTPEEIEKRRQERREAFEKAPEVEFRWAFADYKPVNGIQLPHRLTKSEAGTPNEEWQISKYKINPSFKPDRFEKKTTN